MEDSTNSNQNTTNSHQDSANIPNTTNSHQNSANIPSNTASIHVAPLPPPPPDSALSAYAAASLHYIEQHIAALNAARAKGRNRRLNSLAVAEVILGSICFVVGIITCSISWDENLDVFCDDLCNSQTSTYSINPYEFTQDDSMFCRQISVNSAGEGLWCSIWIIIAGWLGISASSGKHSNHEQQGYLLRCHLTFGTIGAAFSFILFSISLAFGMSAGAERGTYIVLTLLTACLSFLSVIILISSIAFSCCIAHNSRETACGCCDDYRQVIGAGGFGHSMSVPTIPAIQQQQLGNRYVGMDQPFGVATSLTNVMPQSSHHFNIAQAHLSAVSYVPSMTSLSHPQLPGGEAIYPRQLRSIHSFPPPVMNPAQLDQPPTYTEVDPAVAERTEANRRRTVGHEPTDVDNAAVS